MKRLLTLLTISLLMLANISKAQYVNIPDVNFRNFLILKFPTCFNGAGQMDTTCSELNVSQIICSHQNIRDLNGIQYFKNLIELDCSSNNLTSLPKLPPNMWNLICDHNQITSLQDSLPINLNWLICNNNQLTSLPALDSLWNLSQLDCDSNLLSNFPSLHPDLVSKFCSTMYISCKGNINLSCFPKLNNCVEYLDVTGTNVKCFSTSNYNHYQLKIIPNTLPYCNGINNCQQLPINILEYKVKLIKDKKYIVYNEWITGEEINSSYFNIQKSTNGKDFETIGNLRAKGKGSYQYSAPPPPKGGILYYRLEVVDKDGSKTYSEIRKLTIDNGQWTIYPNPAKDIITIESNNIQQIKIVDNTGRTVINKKLETVTSNTKMDVSGLNKGLYLMQVTNNNGETKTEKLIIQ